MKTISPINIWKNGSLEEAVFFNLYVVNDNVKDQAVFYFSLLNGSKTSLAEGNINMSGDDYQGWEQNEYAWNWAAGKLGLTITGDYVPTEEQGN
jgi:hypothetical protein